MGPPVPRKPLITPAVPMKNLHWNKIQLPGQEQETENKVLWATIKEPEVEADELTKLFGRKAAVAMKKREDMVDERSKDGVAATMASAKQVTKILDQKRSQAVGILVQSLRVTINDVENAVIQLDTSVIDVEALQSIYEVRATKEEIDQLRRFMLSGKKAEEPLDKPDQFLWDLAQIPHFQERISCFVFQSSFPDKLGEVAKKLDNLKMTIDSLVKGEEIKKILGIILAFGNYMNGGNRQKGQADGFNLDILPKLKDVKTSDNASNLLQYIVVQYLTKFDKENLGTEKAKLPFPDPSDLKQASLVNFDDLGKEMMAIGKDLKDCKDRTERVLDESNSMRVGPFKSIMVDFVGKATKELKEQTENLTESREKFREIVNAFCFSVGKGKTVEPTDFFGVWLPFVSDFKDTWKREQQKEIKRLEAEARARVKEVLVEKKTGIVTTQKKVGGLKDRLSRKRMDRSLSLPGDANPNTKGGGQDELASIFAKKAASRKLSLDPAGSAGEGGSETPTSNTSSTGGLTTPEQSLSPASSTPGSPRAKVLILREEEGEEEEDTISKSAKNKNKLSKKNDANTVFSDNSPIAESCEFVEEMEAGRRESCEFVESETESCEFVVKEAQTTCEFEESKETYSSDRRGFSAGWIAPVGGKSKIFADDDDEYF